jgi:uncharacterized protein YndB with AHSA1/START domain
MNDFGKVIDASTVRLERLLPGPIGRVWSYLTDPGKRAKWFAGGPMELRVGGRVEFKFNHADLSAEKETPERFKCDDHQHGPGRITRCEPPRVLAFTWGSDAADASEVTFELAPQGDKVKLTLTHRRVADRTSMISFAGGWHIHLDILEDNLEGRTPRPFWTTHAKLDAEYQRRMAE